MTTSHKRHVVLGASLATVLLGGGLVVAGNASANARGRVVGDPQRHQHGGYHRRPGQNGSNGETSDAGSWPAD